MYILYLRLLEIAVKGEIDNDEGWVSLRSTLFYRLGAAMSLDQAKRPLPFLYRGLLLLRNADRQAVCATLNRTPDFSGSSLLYREAVQGFLGESAREPFLPKKGPLAY
jgi:hypothetical protein